MEEIKKAERRFGQEGKANIVFKPQCLGCIYNKSAYDCGILGEKEDLIRKNLKKCEVRTEKR